MADPTLSALNLLIVRRNKKKLKLDSKPRKAHVQKQKKQMSSVLIGGTDAAANAAQAAMVNSNKYRAYVAAVDKALKAFEATNEWADLISALAKLSRVFHTNAKFGDIPKPVTVAKRLSQCLHPALPHGVHLKALETYRQVFDILGRKDLPRLLYLFAVGLFPLMNHCGIKVKSELLNIFEQYLLPLGADLKPALPGFITGVLLGLEEGTEFYDRSFSLLDRVQNSVGREVFFACLWEAVLGSPSVRLPALIYVNAKFDRRKSMDDQLYIMGNNIDHMIAALCAAADDDGSTLVQRHLLDFLCSAFPLNSDHLVREDFVQLLRRCLFLVLRRDMSLNRRLYQWLLNRVGDSAVSVTGADENFDVTFFKTYALPIIKKAVEEYLRLDAVEVTKGVTAYDGTKEHQLQYTEVRVCRLLLYFLGRPEIGHLLLNETLSMLLEHASMRDSRISEWMKEEEESLGRGAFSPTSSSKTAEAFSRRQSVVSRCSVGSRRSRLSNLSSSEESKVTGEQERRVNEFKETINLMLNSLDASFVWNFLSRKLRTLLLQKNVPMNGNIDPNTITNESKMLKEEEELRTALELENFPAVTLFCLKTIEPDTHGEMRDQHLPQLLSSLLTTIAEKNVASMESHLIIQLLSVSKAVLEHLDHGDVITDTTDATPITCLKDEIHEIISEEEDDSSKRLNLKRGIKEQWRLENCLSDCHRLLAQVCDWYSKERNSERLLVFRAALSMMRAFTEFPLYDFIAHEKLGSTRHQKHIPTSHSIWISGLLNVMSLDDWSFAMKQKGCERNLHVGDFHARADSLDLIIDVYMRSVSSFELLQAVLGRRRRSFQSDQNNDERKIATTTILVKPILTEGDLIRIDEDGFFKKAAEVLWCCLGEDSYASYHTKATRLLILLHSRRPLEPSSDVEELIINHLTCSDRIVNGAAAKKFRSMWMLNRPSSGNESCMGSLPSKPFNRVIMLLLSYLSDDSIGYDRAELKSIADAWFNDCARHNDLPFFLQMWATMLLNPSTTRVSIQYLMLHNRINREQIFTMPPGVCSITLLTENGRQSLHHICEDVSKPLTADARRHLSDISPVTDRCRSGMDYPHWFIELRNRLLQEGDQEGASLDISTKTDARTHRRNVSDIPIFDDDNDSVGTVSVDSVDQEVVEVVQYLVDTVCANEEVKESDVPRISMGHHNLSGSSLQTAASDVQESASEIEGESNVHMQTPSTSLEFSVTDAQLSSQSRSKSAENISAFTENMKRRGHRRQDSLQETIFSMSAQELKLFDTELPRLNAAGDNIQPLCHELHAHMLLYVESGRTVDLARSEKVLRMLIALLRAQRGFEGSRLILSCMVSSGTASSTKYTCCSASTQLIDLLMRHIRAILGQDFWASSGVIEGNGSTDTNRNKHYTFLELFLTVSLYFLRSYFLNSPTACVSDTDLRNAWKCKMAALDFLSELLRELIAMISEHQSHALVSYIYGIVQRSKLQKCVLHLLLTSVHSLRSFFPDVAPLSVDIIEFNDGVISAENEFGDLIAGYQTSLLELTAVVIQLEMVMKNGFEEYSDQADDSMYLEKLSINQQIYNSPQHRQSLREPPYGMVELRMLLLTVVNALKRNPVRQEQWFTFILRILPFLDRSLPLFSLRIVEQLCKNLENAISAAYKWSDAQRIAEVPKDDYCREYDEQNTAYPSNYAVNVLETLTTYIHYCLIDTSSTASPGASFSGSQQTSQAAAASSQSLASSVMNAIPGTKGASELFTNLVKVFSFSDSTNVPSNNGLNKYGTRGSRDGLRQARIEIINTFPHVLSTVCEMWTHLRRGEPSIPIGSSVQLRKLILDLLSLLVQHQQQPFLSSLALVWITRSTVPIPAHKHFASRAEPDQPYFAYSAAQLDIAELILSIDVLPFENLIAAVTEAMKECAFKSVRPNVPSDKPSAFPTELALLEILHGCVRSTPASALLSYWHPLQVLFTETPIMNLPPRAVFLQFIILADFVQMAGSSTIVEDKQMSRAAQDACQKLTEAVNVIVGWQLEQTTWLKRTLVVKHDSNAQKSQDTSPVVEFATAPTSIAASENNSLRGSTASLIQSRLPTFDTATQFSSTSQGGPTSTASVTEKKGSVNLKPSLKDPNNPKRDSAHSTQALFLLAEHLTELIDSICKSEDKERLLPLLQSVWSNTLPYLKAKHARNARFFIASSQLLASMSTFNYMRPVWRKTTLDLLLDPAFFKMDLQSLKHWLVVIDHLMTHDKTSFKELLVRISTTQNSALSSLITSKEAEYELRAQALKRLAFVVLSSEIDQYQAQLPDIQERLSDNLRLSQVPIVHAQVFLCYRVLLIRVKPMHLYSMWPSMVTELVHVLLQIEQQLKGTTNVSDDLKCDRNDQWMQLYLAACKLLETLCTLPSGYLSQFQMCHWAFVNSVASSGAESFKPFAIRIDQLLRNKFGQLTPHDKRLLSASLVSMKTLTNFGELRPFFLALATQNKTISLTTQSFDKDDQLRDAIYLIGSLPYKAAVNRLKHALYIDFAEHWQL